MILSEILHPSHPLILEHYFIIKKKNKIEKYIKILELTFEQLYESEFEKEEHNLFLSKNIPLDWIIWFDSYNHKFRDALYSYGYRIHTANYLKDLKCKKSTGSNKVLPCK